MIAKKKKLMHLTVSLELEGVSDLPVSTAGGSNNLVRLVATLAQSATSTACRGKSTKFTVLVHWVSNPLNTRIFTDSIVLRIYHNNFKVFVCRVSVYPVRVKNTKVSTSASNTLFSKSSQTSASLVLVNSLVGGLSVNNSLAVWSLASSASYSNTVYNVPLLCFVSQSVSFFWAGWAMYLHNRWQLAVFPCANTKQETHNVTLLLAPKLFHVFVASHLDLVIL
mmetsp:Transcript_33202/g.53453  ORF Transcript_33202/g.53453 Transcript_33202/m.53453 type:complete len:223 (-) Transcript_33202:549-1217(-)